MLGNIRHVKSQPIYSSSPFLFLAVFFFFLFTPLVSSHPADGQSGKPGRLIPTNCAVLAILQIGHQTLGRKMENSTAGSCFHIARARGELFRYLPKFFFFPARWGPTHSGQRDHELGYMELQIAAYALFNSLACTRTPRIHIVLRLVGSFR